MNFHEYRGYDAVGLAKLVAAGEVTAAELVELAVAAAQRVNGKLNAVVHERYQRARAEAANPRTGVFRGVPFLLKDLLGHMEGEPMCSGSRAYASFVSDHNSELVNRYLGSGVIVLGKTNTPEFGLVPSTEPKLFGPTRNPWDLERTAGGSSGGSAAAIAAGVVPMASGGDGGGSIRIPASCCGLFGFKPTRGRTPCGPDSADLWAGFAVEHVLSRSVRDSAVMLDWVAGPNSGDVFSLPAHPGSWADDVERDPGPLRVALSTTPLLPAEGVDADCVRAVEDTGKLLESLGHQVEEATPVISSNAFARAFAYVVASHTAALARQAERDLGRKIVKGDFEVPTQLSVVLGRKISGGDYVDSLGFLRAQARQVLAFFDDYDLLVTPTLPCPPPQLGFLEPTGPAALLQKAVARLELGSVVAADKVLDTVVAETFSFIPWTPVFNVTGQPSMSVPLAWNDASLPIGVMVTGGFGDESTLFKLAGQLERARPWDAMRPPDVA